MRRRVLLASVIASVTLCASAMAASVVVKPSYAYTGRSVQGIPVHLAAEVDGARWFRYRATMTCNDGSTFLDDYFSDDVHLSHNRFSVAVTSNAGAVSTKVTGTLSGTTATGTIRIIERFSQVAVNGATPLAADGSIVCDSQTVKWSARA